MGVCWTTGDVLILCNDFLNSQTGTIFVARGCHDYLWSKVLEVTDDYVRCEQPRRCGGDDMDTVGKFCFIALFRFGGSLYSYTYVS